MGILLPPPLIRPNTKPNLATQLQLNPESIYPAPAVAWVGGHTGEGVDAAGTDFQVGTVAPKAMDDAEGIVSNFPNGIESYYDFGPKAWLEVDEPFTVAFRVKWTSRTFNQLAAIKTDSNEPLQFFFADSGSYRDFNVISDNEGDWGRRGINSVPAGSWHSIVLSVARDGWASTANRTFYADGVDLGTGINTGGPSSRPNLNSWGRTAAGSDFYGRAAGFRLWPGVEMEPSLAKEMSLNYWAPFGQPVEIDPVQREYFFFGEEAAAGISIDTGHYPYTGYDIELTAPTQGLTIETGHYAYTGYDIALTRNYALPIDTGHYAYTGYDIGLSTALGMSIETGHYAYTGYDIELIAPLGLTIETGHYPYTGYDITLTSTAASKWGDIPGTPGNTWEDTSGTGGNTWDDI